MIELRSDKSVDSLKIYDHLNAPKMVILFTKYYVYKKNNNTYVETLNPTITKSFLL